MYLNEGLYGLPYGSGLGLSRCLGPGECLHSYGNLITDLITKAFIISMYRTMQRYQEKKAAVPTMLWWMKRWMQRYHAVVDAAALLCSGGCSGALQRYRAAVAVSGGCSGTMQLYHAVVDAVLDALGWLST